MIPTPGWCASRGAAELFGLSIVPIPSLKVATDGRALSGFLVPDFRISSSNGAEASTTYYARIADNRDLAITGYAFTKVRPMAKLRYRALTDNGAYQITGYLTQSTATTVSGTNSAEQWRGYLDANGHFQLSTNWSIDFSGGFASDRTFLRRYYINSDDTLRSTVNVERIDNSSLSLDLGLGLPDAARTNEQQGLVPIALPMIDYRRRIEMGPWRHAGTAGQHAGHQPQRRAGYAARLHLGAWSLRRITGMGQVVTLTGLVRGDVYHSSSNALTSTVLYQASRAGKAAPSRWPRWT
jgi:LPS-assembly protein